MEDIVLTRQVKILKYGLKKMNNKWMGGLILLKFWANPILPLDKVLKLGSLLLLKFPTKKKVSYY